MSDCKHECVIEKNLYLLLRHGNWLGGWLQVWGH